MRARRSPDLLVAQRIALRNPRDRKAADRWATTSPGCQAVATGRLLTAPRAGVPSLTVGGTAATLERFLGTKGAPTGSAPVRRRVEGWSAARHGAGRGSMTMTRVRTRATRKKEAKKGLMGNETGPGFPGPDRFACGPLSAAAASSHARPFPECSKTAVCPRGTRRRAGCVPDTRRARSPDGS
jgi:hypothetical protein